MKRTGAVKTIIPVLIVVTAAATVLHLTTRAAVSEGALRVEFDDGKAAELFREKLTLIPVQGTVVNGKGEERAIHAWGILLSEVLRQAGVSDYSEVTVIADDEYSAKVTAEEITEPDKVYLIQQEDNGMQLIVFGDKNSKRNVSNVVRLSVQ